MNETEIKSDLEYVRNQKCEVCFKNPPNDAAHIVCKRIADKEWRDSFSNLMTLCRQHHQEQHRIGIRTFASKYCLPIDISGIYPRRK